jgi:hypothetical protein
MGGEHDEEKGKILSISGQKKFLGKIEMGKRKRCKYKLAL